MGGTETSHTSGPWQYSDGSIWGTSPWNARVRLADIRTHAPMNGINSQANANLIAASPALLKALEWAVSFIEERGEAKNSDELMSYKSAKAAIAQARGDA
jgi:hypothetical protein